MPSQNLNDVLAFLSKVGREVGNGSHESSDGLVLLLSLCLYIKSIWYIARLGT